MNNEELNTVLYQKMAWEQNKYREWLLQCSPEEILAHAYEYAVREDILMAMEELNLPDEQVKATDYMETVRGVIESCAERKAAMEQKREAR